MKQKFLSALLIIFLVGVVVFQCVSIKNIENSRNQLTTEETQDALITATPQTTLPQTTLPQTTLPTDDVADDNDTTTVADSAEKENDKPESTKEIIDQYTLLVDKFKQQKPAYTKKEYQALPVEYHNFSSIINKFLDLASGYMVTEDEAEELVRAAGAEEIINDMPIHGSEKGCALTDYDAVEWAKCEDKGDGTYEISFSLKEEVNPEPTPADTLVPVSAHGAVMQPMAFADIKAEVDKVIAKIPGVALNQLDLYYHENVYSCVYNPETDEVLSITHHIVIDIVVNADLFSKTIDGSARLLNEMFIYDITW
jgi:hypothetical protein